MRRKAYAWKGSVQEFALVGDRELEDDLVQHYVGLNAERPSDSQRVAWRDTVSILREAFDHADTSDHWGLILEYELPFEGGRRPDVVVLAGGAIVVLEFKGAPIIQPAHGDQAAAYRRDLMDYHEASRDLPVQAVVVTSANDDRNDPAFDVPVVGRQHLGALLSELACSGSIDLDTWLAAPYAPLPSLVAAARRIFQHEPLPHVRRAIAARVPETVELISRLDD